MEYFGFCWYDFYETVESNPTDMYNIEVIEEIKDYMISNNQTLAVAESVTSGHLQAAISLAIEASKFFHGGITAYNLGQKARHLHVNPIHATTCNSVSQLIADQMALQAMPLFSSDWSIGITGYASPLPEMGIDDLFAFYAIGFRHQIVHHGKLEAEDRGTYSVQVYYADEVLRHLSNHLSSVPKSRDGR